MVAALSLGASATMSFRLKKVKMGKGPGRGAGSTSKDDGAGGRAESSRAVLNLRLNHGVRLLMVWTRVHRSWVGVGSRYWLCPVWSQRSGDRGKQQALLGTPSCTQFTSNMSRRPLEIISQP